MASSLQEITYDQLLKQLPTDVIEKLRATEKRGNIHIFKLALDERNDLNIFHTFENATMSELPGLMKDFPNDKLIEWNPETSLFHYCLEKHKKELEGHQMFKEALSEMNQDWISSFTVSPELIAELYTNILTYNELIDDINNFCDDDFAICFEVDRSWKLIERLLHYWS